MIRTANHLPLCALLAGGMAMTPAAAPAQNQPKPQPLTIRGVVVDAATGEGINCVKVSAYRGSDDDRAETKSNANGQAGTYEVKLPAGAGTCVVYFNHEGARKCQRKMYLWHQVELLASGDLVINKAMVADGSAQARLGHYTQHAAVVTEAVRRAAKPGVPAAALRERFGPVLLDLSAGAARFPNDAGLQAAVGAALLAAEDRPAAALDDKQFLFTKDRFLTCYPVRGGKVGPEPVAWTVDEGKVGSPEGPLVPFSHKLYLGTSKDGDYLPIGTDKD